MKRATQHSSYHVAPGSPHMMPLPFSTSASSPHHALFTFLQSSADTQQRVLPQLPTPTTLRFPSGQINFTIEAGPPLIGGIRSGGASTLS